MELRHLRAFVAVAEEAHFGRAAQRLHMAQPPLSQQVKQLERELGVLLLERTTRRVRTTNAGVVFLERARAILSDVERARESVLLAERGESGVIRVGLTGATTWRLLPRLARAYRKRYPMVRLELQPAVFSGQQVSADFHAASLTPVSGELVAESSVAPPGHCGVLGEVGLAEDG